jgi:hypothetical protein
VKGKKDIIPMGKRKRKWGENGEEKEKKLMLEMRGIEPRASRMQSERSTI